MTGTTKKMASMTAVTIALFSLGLTAIVIVPDSAEAHNCWAKNPEKSCGECRTGNHAHQYNGGTNYCSSTDAEAAADCVLAVLEAGVCDDFVPYFADDEDEP